MGLKKLWRNYKPIILLPIKTKSLYLLKQLKIVIMETGRYFVNEKGELVKKVGKTFFKVNTIVHFRRKTLIFAYSK